MKKTLLLVAAFMTCFAFGVQAQTPCGAKYGATPEDSTACRQNITAFSVHYKAKNYNDSYMAWRKLVEICPCSWNGIFINGTTMLENLIKAEQDSVRREQLIDTLLWTYDIRPKYDESYTEGRGLGFKAFYILKYRQKQLNDIDKLKEVFYMFERSVDLEKEETDPDIWNQYFTLASRLAPALGDTSIVIDAYERANEYIDDAKVKCYERLEADTAELTALQAKFDANEIDKMKYDKEAKVLTSDTTRQYKLLKKYDGVFAKIEKQFLPFASCEMLEKIYAGKLEENKSNIPLLQKMLKTLDRTGCRTSTIYKDILEIVYTNAPTAASAEMMGGFYFAEKDYDKASTFYNEAIKMYTTNEKRTQPYYYLANIEYLKKNFSAARNYAYKALSCNANFGKAYMLIGDMYAASSIGGDDAIPGAQNWAAVDKYNKAVAVDPSLANDVAKRRSRLKFPDGAVVFQKGYSKGQTYRVGGWIGETTTIR